MDNLEWGNYSLVFFNSIVLPLDNMMQLHPLWLILLGLCKLRGLFSNQADMRWIKTIKTIDYLTILWSHRSFWRTWPPKLPTKPLKFLFWTYSDNFLYSTTVSYVSMLNGLSAKHRSSCQNIFVLSCRKGRKGSIKLSSRTNCLEGTSCFSSRPEIKSEDATCTITDGSGSTSIAFSSLWIHGSILFSILSLTPLFPAVFRSRQLWEKQGTARKCCSYMLARHWRTLSATELEDSDPDLPNHLCLGKGLIRPLTQSNSSLDLLRTLRSATRTLRLLRKASTLSFLISSLISGNLCLRKVREERLIWENQASKTALQRGQFRFKSLHLRMQSTQ